MIMSLTDSNFTLLFLGLYVLLLILFLIIFKLPTRLANDKKLAKITLFISILFPLLRQWIDLIDFRIFFENISLSLSGRIGGYFSVQYFLMPIIQTTLFFIVLAALVLVIKNKGSNRGLLTALVIVNGFLIVAEWLMSMLAFGMRGFE